MRLYTKTLLAAAVLIAAPMAANAESTFNSTGAGNATARLDFQINVPRVLFLRVGTGADNTTDGTINKITFDVPAATMGNATAVNATSGGDVSPGVVTAKVVGNNGTITLTSNTTGPLSNGTDTISYSQINTAVAPGVSATPLAHPTLADGAGAVSISVAPAVGKVVSRDAKWTYTYANAAVVAAGTYGGVNTNGSRVTYTAAMP